MVLVPLFDLRFLTELAAGGVGPSNRRHECPVSEVRDTPQQALTRTSETMGALITYGSSAAFRFEVPNGACCKWCRNFKSAALDVVHGLLSYGQLFGAVARHHR